MGVYILIVVAVLLYFIGTYTYRKKEFSGLGKEKYKFSFLYAGCAFLLDKLQFFRWVRVKEKEKSFVQLYPGGDGKKRFEYFVYEKMSYFVVLFVSVNCLCTLISYKEQKGATSKCNTTLDRPCYGSGSESIDINTTLVEGEKVLNKKFSLEVMSQQYTKQQVEQQMEEAKSILSDGLLGENESYEEIERDLLLKKEIGKTEIKVDWESSNDEVISETGVVHNEGLDKKEKVTLVARLSYEELEKEYEFQFTVLPPKLTWEETVSKAYITEVENRNQNSIYDSKLQLPTTVGDIEVIYHNDKSNKAHGFFILGCIICFSFPFVLETRNRRQMKMREKELLWSYPDMIHKITLLMGAGMNVKRAWTRMIEGYLQEKRAHQGKVNYMYEEMIITWNEMNNGITEVDAISRFGRRIQLKPYLRFSSLLCQNMRKGAKGLLSQLEFEGKEALIERQQIAKRLGEEAATKMLFPMIIMLAIVLLIVMIPAVLSIS